MDHQDRFAIDLLDLFRCHQVGHAHLPPARLSLPQHGVHGGQQGANVALLPLDPVQNLGHGTGEGEGGNRGPLASEDQILNNMSSNPLNYYGSGEMFLKQ